jgi:SAM-dependent methyltransferase
VLGGAPILVPEPAQWCAAFYDSALSALAEVALADDVSVSTLRAFADGMRGAEAQRFADDWTREELEGRAPPVMVEGVGTQALNELVALSEVQSVREWLASRVEGRCVVEVGCGAGVLSEKLSPAKQLVVIDSSLRAVLQASQRSGGYPVVGDAMSLPLQKASVDSLVAENVVDLLEAPGDFFVGAQQALKKRGRLLVCTPEPSLNDPDQDDATLAKLAEGVGFVVSDVLDGAPWLRRHSPRHLEVYLVQALCLIK